MFCLVNRLRSFAAVRDYFVGGVLTIGVKASPIGNISLGSMSITRTLQPSSFKPDASAPTVVVFEQPPFRFATEYVLPILPSTWDY